MSDKTPKTFIQWKGTEVCMDFHCPCGTSYHIDADFIYYIKCVDCDQTWKLGSSVEVTAADKEESEKGYVYDPEFDRWDE